MDYVAIKRTRFHSLSGDVNIPYGTKIDCANGILHINGKPLCFERSQNAYNNFAKNDDGMGLERGKLIQTILKTLCKRDKNHQDRWDRVWKDPICQQYKRPDHTDHWIWNYEFYNADVADLKYITALVGIKI